MIAINFALLTFQQVFLVQGIFELNRYINANDPFLYITLHQNHLT